MLQNNTGLLSKYHRCVSINMISWNQLCVTNIVHYYNDHKKDCFGSSIAVLET